MFRQVNAANQEHLLETLIQSVNEIVWCTSADGSELLFINRAAEQVYGRSVEELMQRPSYWLDAVHADDRDRFDQHIADLRKVGHIEVEYRIVRPDGSIRWLLDNTALGL